MRGATSIGDPVSKQVALPESSLVLSRDTCKNLQDGLESIAISTFQRFLVED